MSAPGTPAGVREIHGGGCLCGDVRYRTLGRPETTTVCHCNFCQRLTGSAFLVKPLFLAANVEIEHGTPGVFDYKSPDHGRTVSVNFCARCGTHLSVQFERLPGLQGICAGTFDDPTWIQPDRHIFIESAASWMVFPQHVDCYVRHAIATDGTPEKPWQTARYVKYVADKAWSYLQASDAARRNAASPANEADERREA